MSTFTNARFIHYNNKNNKSRVQTPHNVQSLFTFHPSVEFSLSPVLVFRSCILQTDAQCARKA